ncbi:MAG: Hsp20/alpha crystallin family protein [Firmicutes bacterium]|nr:Hsp20/alpha crystallin family protein [Bacillota bacterium]
MMLMPKRNDFDLFDNFFGDDMFFNSKKNNLMKTDIKETKNSYIIDMDLPGYDKDNINLSLEDGYLKINAKVEKEDNGDSDEKYVRRERFVGECSRSFYVGDDIVEEDIDAEFKNGILKVTIPKKEQIENKKEVKQIEIK